MVKIYKYVENQDKMYILKALLLYCFCEKLFLAPTGALEEGILSVCVSVLGRL